MFSSNNLTASNKKSTKNQHLATENPQVEIIKKEPIVIDLAQINTTISEAFTLTLDLKANMINKNSFVQYKSRVGLFEKWMKEKEYYKNTIDFITKKIVIEYLNEVLKRRSARNRNNSRTDIASMFQLLEDCIILK